MIVEFAGCTGAGKTTISYRVIEKLSKKGIGLRSLHPYRFSAGGRFFRGLKNETLQNVVMDIKALLYIMASFGDNADLVKFSWGILKDRSDSFVEGVNLFRSVVRKIGASGVLRDTDKNGAVTIMDEGIVHSIHNLFVHYDSDPDMNKLEDFSRRITLPDLIVYVRSPLGLVVDRTKRRKDVSRRIRPDDLDKYIKKADRVFEKFMGFETVKGRVLRLDCNRDSEQTIEELSDRVVERVEETIKHA